MTKVKICGLSRVQDIEYVNLLMPDYIGFVFAPSSRQVSVSEAQALKSCLKAGIQVMGVFVNADTDRIEALCKDGIIDIIQLHGGEDEAYITELRRRVSNPIIQAVGVSEQFDLPATTPDYFLFDNEKGGSGRTFDWRLLQNYHKPYFLAGGLNADNVVAAIKTLKPYCVDVSSGLETDGKKDFIKMRQFMDLVRSEML